VVPEAIWLKAISAGDSSCGSSSAVPIESLTVRLNAIPAWGVPLTSPESGSKVKPAGRLLFAARPNE
jgi:hypothetical protein